MENENVSFDGQVHNALTKEEASITSDMGCVGAPEPASTPDRMFDNPPKKRGSGFGKLTSEEHRAASSRGGKNAHAQHRAHEFSSDEARRAAAIAAANRTKRAQEKKLANEGVKTGT